MSRIGKKPITIPAGVETKIENGKMLVKGPKGENSLDLVNDVKVEIANGQIIVSLVNENRQSKPYWGLFRTLIDNMIQGVVSGFEKKLEIQGIGYTATLDGENLVLKAGYSHLVKINKEPGIKFIVEKNIITVSGVDKVKVGNMAAKIRAVRKPEPYQGKGIRYAGEQVRRKLGKKAAKAA